MNKCIFCDYKTSTITELRQHYLRAHPGEKPFKCNLCNRRYKHFSSCQRHEETCPSLVKTKATAKILTDLSQNAAQNATTDEKSHPFLAYCAKDVDRPVESTAQSILRLVNNSEILPDMPYDNIDMFVDKFYLFEDECFSRNVTLKTVSNYVRQYIHYVAFLQETNRENIDDEIIAFLQLRSTELSSLATKSLINDNALILQDPYAMATIRNNIILQLNKYQQEQIDPFLLKHIRAGTVAKTKVLLAFGHEHFKPFLELLMRFANIPCRIQITKNLLLPNDQTSHYVAKLVRCGNQYTRLIHQDKVQVSHVPLAIPLGFTISCYLELYIQFCRPNTDLPYLFLSKHGKKWTNASKDLKAFMKDALGIPVERLDPTGRFVHGSRHIVLAAYALQCQFDHQKLANFATLLRHSLDTSLKFYNVFSQLWRSKLAVKDFSESLGLNIDTSTNAANVFVHAKPGLPHALLRTTVHQLWQDKDINQVEFTVRSIGTQTETSSLCDASEIGHVSSANQISQTKQANPQNKYPKCQECKAVLRVHGPIGNKRSPYFGRYFLQCLQCHPQKRFAQKSAFVFDLGFKPANESVSNKPRNMADILAFIEKSKKKQ